MDEPYTLALPYHQWLTVVDALDCYRDSFCEDNVEHWYCSRTAKLIEDMLPQE